MNDVDFQILKKSAVIYDPKTKQNYSVKTNVNNGVNLYAYKLTKKVKILKLYP